MVRSIFNLYFFIIYSIIYYYENQNMVFQMVLGEIPVPRPREPTHKDRIFGMHQHAGSTLDYPPCLIREVVLPPNNAPEEVKHLIKRGLEGQVRGDYPDAIASLCEVTFPFLYEN